MAMSKGESALTGLEQEPEIKAGTEKMTDMNRLNVILLGKEASSLANVASVLMEQRHFHVTCFTAAEEVWTYLQSNKLDVAVVSEVLQDCTGLQFIKNLVTKHPFVNCALTSPLSKDQFHEETEGYGVFMQLPVNPSAQSAGEMIEHLDKIYQLIDYHSKRENL
jgi:DNA-binding NtrC family response regulator